MEPRIHVCCKRCWGFRVENYSINNSRGDKVTEMASRAMGLGQRYRRMERERGREEGVVRGVGGGGGR